MRTDVIKSFVFKALLDELWHGNINNDCNVLVSLYVMKITIHLEALHCSISFFLVIQRIHHNEMQLLSNPQILKHESFSECIELLHISPNKRNSNGSDKLNLVSQPPYSQGQ